MSKQSVCTTLTDGTKEWRRNGQYHRKNGPAIECTSGCKHWFQNGMPHREDGPAIEHSDGNKEWWIRGIQLDIMQTLENPSIQVRYPKLYESILDHKVECTCDCGRTKVLTIRELVSGVVTECDEESGKHSMNALLN
jgi:hypothetical protein